jgi:hypothetical protein
MIYWQLWLNPLYGSCPVPLISSQHKKIPSDVEQLMSEGIFLVGLVANTGKQHYSAFFLHCLIHCLVDSWLYRLCCRPDNHITDGHAIWRVDRKDYCHSDIFRRQAPFYLCFAHFLGNLAVNLSVKSSRRVIFL